MAFSNGLYQNQLSDVSDFAELASLYGCGCESNNVTAQGGLFDSVPTWFWIGALAVGAMIALKKGR